MLTILEAAFHIFTVVIRTHKIATLDSQINITIRFDRAKRWWKFIDVRWGIITETVADWRVRVLDLCPVNAIPWNLDYTLRIRILWRSLKIDLVISEISYLFFMNHWARAMISKSNPHLVGCLDWALWVSTILWFESREAHTEHLDLRTPSWRSLRRVMESSYWLGIVFIGSKRVFNVNYALISKLLTVKWNLNDSSTREVCLRSCNL